jgi:hypothetical protein
MENWKGTTMITLVDTRKAVDYFEAKLEFTTGRIELNSMIGPAFF